MLKVRLQGTLNDIRWFKGLLERNEQVKVQEVQSHLPIKEQISIFVFMQR